MIDAVSDWIKNIIMIVLFASFLELLLPSSSMQKFIRVIIGLFITLAILNPIIDIIQNRFGPNQIPALSTNASNSQVIINNATKLADQREQMSVELYKKELAKQIRATVIAVDGVADAQVAVDISNEKKGKLIDVKNITVFVKPGVSANEGKIAKVTIGSTSSADRPELKPQTKAKISYTINELYQIPKDSIEIKALH
ncbi:stage III sporulation protein AF [Dendrosporobacter sp. 1207_IL3150]|uniref:stage III sporulation protein AF n=1 Tax=Dendrosporobacter sp. 1207_IL3150 TaxID=3084054 RepID=UPI002FD9C1EF